MALMMPKCSIVIPHPAWD